MQPPLPALTSDNALISRLQESAEAMLGCQIPAPRQTADEWLNYLKAQNCPSLLVDCRVEYFDRVAEEVIRRLARAELPAVNVWTMGSGYFPVSCAAELELLSCGHVPFVSDNLDGDDDLVRSLFDLIPVRTPRMLPDSRHIHSSSVEITTYTPDYFPVLDDLLRVAAREVTILFVGETGTGKTTLARFVHDLSPRRHRQFQHLACGALPGDLIESELFGHMRGSFTGADRNKIGRFEAAGQGTLLLDEIDVLDPKQQTKLLKVIETGEYEMVGSTDPRKSEARLIVASNVNLQDLTDQGRFRSDLYYRLNVLEFRLPALRDRPLDISFLAMQFVRELASEHRIPVSRVHRNFLDALRHYDWPGNLRELRNHVSRAVLFCQNGELSVNDLSHKIVKAQFMKPAANPQEHTVEPDSWKLSHRVAETERAMLLEALRANGNNRTRTARALGISRVGLYKKMRRLGLLDEPAVS